MPDRALLVANLLLPGAGLLARGRAIAGSALLAAALVCAALAVAGAAGLGGAPEGTAWRGVAGYAALAALAAAAQWRLDRRRPLDPAAVRAAHRAAAGAWIRREYPIALEHARRLARVAPDEPGAWSLLALIARDAGDTATARRAQGRARALEVDAARAAATA